MGSFSNICLPSQQHSIPSPIQIRLFAHAATLNNSLQIKIVLHLWCMNYHHHQQHQLGHTGVPNPTLDSHVDDGTRVRTEQCAFGHHFHIRFNSFFRQPSLFLGIINKTQVNRAFVFPLFFSQQIQPQNALNCYFKPLMLNGRYMYIYVYVYRLSMMGRYFYLEALCCTGNKSMTINLS